MVTAFTDLPIGVVYWRLFGAVGTSIGTVPSPTWQFTVGARTAPANASWGSILDVNGDGFADVAIGSLASASTNGRADLYFGSATGVPATASVTLSPPDPLGRFGAAIANADVDGDGFVDLIVSAPWVGANNGRVYVYRGGSTGVASTPTTTLSGPDGAGNTFGLALNNAGDVNGDGYADIVVGAYQYMSNTGRAYLFFGSATGLALTPSAFFDSPVGANGQFGFSVTGGGDLNGDGFADVVISARYASTGVGRAFAYYGGASGPATTPSVTFNAPDLADSWFGSSVAIVGDLDGDGVVDLGIGAYHLNTFNGRAYVYSGSATAFSPTPTHTLDPPELAGGFGWSITGGDVTNDGFSDIVVGAITANGAAGRAHVYAGALGGLASAPTVTLDGPGGANGNFASSMAFAGDVNGDQRGDLVVGEPGSFSMAGRAYEYSSTASGLPMTPTVTFIAPAGGGFGTAVACYPPTRIRPRG
jgi:hypothetical protein